jgi:hypothetical protein
VIIEENRVLRRSVRRGVAIRRDGLEIRSAREVEGKGARADQLLESVRVPSRPSIAQG